MAGIGRTARPGQVAADANFFVTGVSLSNGSFMTDMLPNMMNVEASARHAFTNQGGADGRVPVATTVKIYETVLGMSRDIGRQCKIQLVNVESGGVHHTFDSGVKDRHTSSFWHWVHNPPLEFIVPANNLLIARVWINGSFHRVSLLYIGTRS